MIKDVNKAFESLDEEVKESMPKLKEQLKKSIFEKVKLEQKLKSYEENQNEKTEIIAS